jgi:threonine dehydratase
MTNRALRQIASAREMLAGELHRTPILSLRSVETGCGVRILLKAELLQKTGSFKPRGVLARLARLSEQDRRRGVICTSAGNHAQAVAWAASRSGVSALTVMPKTTPRAKLEATKRYGAGVILHGQDAIETYASFDAIVEETGRVVIPPFDDPDMITGHASLGLELVEDEPTATAVIVPVGGGGLLAGVAQAVKESRPAIRVIGVEPVGAACLRIALDAGRVVPLHEIKTVAEGLAAPYVGELTLEMANRYVDDVVLVSDEEIAYAMRLLLERAKLQTEPAGAAAVAALLTDRCGLQPGSRAVAILSGGNIDAERLKALI